MCSEQKWDGKEFNAFNRGRLMEQQELDDDCETGGGGNIRFSTLLYKYKPEKRCRRLYQQLEEPH